MKRKTLRRSEWPEIVKRGITVRCLSTSEFCGTAGLTVIGRMPRPFAVGDTVLADEGWRWLQLAPRGAHWWLTAMFDPQHRHVESYFDITLENDFSDPLDPSFSDLYLDIAIPAGGEPMLLDEDELCAALAAGEITPAQAALARESAQALLAALRAQGEAFPRRLAALYRALLRAEEA